MTRYRRRTLWLLLVLVASTIAVCVADARNGSGASKMTLGEAALLGTIEGLTEYLPVSSTGHLLVAQRAMGIGTATEEDKRAADAFAICIQAGAILAVLGLYFGRVRQMGRGLLGRDDDGRRLLVNLVAGFVPAAAVGLAFGDQVKEHLFGPWPVVLAWAIGGAAILFVAWRRDHAKERPPGLTLEAMTWRLALLIGLAQCIAMWPGVSRSLITIVGGVLVGLSLRAAIEFSFLLGLVTLGAATTHDAIRHGALMLETYSPAALFVGMTFAFVSAVLSVRWLVRYLQSHGLAIFGWYRLALAAVVTLLLVNGAL